MILILEDDADRERFQMGHPFNDEFFDHATMRIPTVWISTEAYEEKIRADERERWTDEDRVEMVRDAAKARTLADLRAKVDRLPVYLVDARRDPKDAPLHAVTVHLRDVLAVIDGSSDGQG